MHAVGPFSLLLSTGVLAYATRRYFANVRLLQRGYCKLATSRPGARTNATDTACCSSVQPQRRAITRRDRVAVLRRSADHFRRLGRTIVVSPGEIARTNRSIEHRLWISYGRATKAATAAAAATTTNNSINDDSQQQQMNTHVFIHKINFSSLQNCLPMRMPSPIARCRCPRTRRWCWCSDHRQSATTSH